jgi:prepilin signal peptidase PulO-like enzyme (type II secretory pathway)
MHGSPLLLLGTAAGFGFSAYLGVRVAALVYGNEAPLPDGPVPANVPVLLLVAAAVVLGTVSALRGVGPANLLVLDAVAFALCAVVWTDLTRGFIGDWFTIPPFVLVVALAAFAHDLLPVAEAVGIVTLPFAAAALLSKGMGMGWGDVKLVALGAALLDVQTSVLLYASACVLACGVALVRRRRAEPIAFAPYLAAAIAVGLALPAAPSFG